MTRWTLVALAFLGAGCASLPSSQELDALALQLHQTSFTDRGIAKVDRIKQDLDQQACSSDQPPADSLAERIQVEARAAVPRPADGYFGDWREGEKLAQNGRGMTWTDASAAPAANGGNCYNCHQISKQEISFGNIGPSLYQYGRNRGVSDLKSPIAQGIVEYTWAKLWNPRSYSACSQMPRFGHKGLLDQKQLTHLMSLLHDPQSPVNAQ